MAQYDNAISSSLSYINNKKKHIYIYKAPKLFKYINKINNIEWIYTVPILNLKYTKIFFSKDDGKSGSIKNNAILIELKNKNFIHISPNGIMKIKLKDDIKKILSPKSETIIVGKENVYDIFEMYITGFKRNLFPKKMTNSDWTEIYYYALYGKKELKKVGKKKKWIITEEPYKQFVVNKKIIENFL
jgi:hypothetical protein